ncbi:MAG: DUF5718 family protein [Treponema sp.]|nr:DUF5718 family protein [Treponema sp.]
MFDFYSTKEIPCFGVAGNFTGHLEQAGEAVDFANVKIAEANAPKAVFPTYIPAANSPTLKTPNFLKIYPFDSTKIIFPAGEEKLQIEPECAIIFEAEWKQTNGTEKGLATSTESSKSSEQYELVSLKPICFGASNDCSIRKQGAKKISQKKNWGACSKGFSSNLIPADYFEFGSIFDRYRIASFLVRDGIIHPYGEDSAIRGYSYFYKKLTDWLLEKFNGQKDEGPAEDIHSYLVESGCPEKIMVSVGATRYTDWGEHNFLQTGDKSVVLVYPKDKYSKEVIVSVAKKLTSEQDSLEYDKIIRQFEDISVLIQLVQI